MSHRQQQSRKSGYGDADDDDDSTPAPRSGMSVPRIDKFDGNNWEGFASQFNSLADYYNWNSKERLLQLLHHVRDDARQFVYTKCDDSVRESYPKLEKALKQRFGANENKASFLYQLENIRFGPRDSLIEQGPQSRLHQQQQGPPQFWNPPPQQQQQRQGNLQNDGGNSGPNADATDTDQHHAAATNQGNS